MKKILFFAVIALCALNIPSAAADAPADKKEQALVSTLKKAWSSEERTAALKGLSDYYLSINRLEKAVNAYRSTINDVNISKRERYCYFMTIGDLYLAAKQYSSVMEYYKEAVNVLPKAEEARLKLAGAFEQSDLNELAKQAYLDDLKINKRSFDANFGLASLYMKMGLSTQAMEYYRRTLTIKADSAVYRKTAECAEVSGEIAIALAMLRQIPSLEWTYDDLTNLGRLYSASGKFKEAEESFSLAIKANTDDINGYIHLALLYLGNGDLDPAEKLLQIALEKAPEEGAVHFFLGCIYSAQKKPDLARQELKMAGTLSRTDILKTYSRKYQEFLSK